MKAFLVFLFFALAGNAADETGCSLSTATTCISDRVYTPNGIPVTGTIDIGPSCAFEASGGRIVPTHRVHVVIHDGLFGVSLIPSETPGPRGCQHPVYEAVFNLTHGGRFVQYWRVYPSLAPLSIKEVFWRQDWMEIR
jgi:hypothetical protein